MIHRYRPEWLPWLMGLSDIAQGLVVVFSLGMLRPDWSFGLSIWVLNRRYKDDEVSP